MVLLPTMVGLDDVRCLDFLAASSPVIHLPTADVYFESIVSSGTFGNDSQVKSFIPDNQSYQGVITSHAMVRFLPYRRCLVPWMFGCLGACCFGYCLLVAVKEFQGCVQQFCSLALVKSSPFQLLGVFHLVASLLAVRGRDRNPLNFYTKRREKSTELGTTWESVSRAGP